MAVASLASLAASCDGNSWIKVTVKEKDGTMGLWRLCGQGVEAGVKFSACLSTSEAFKKEGKEIRETHISIFIVWFVLLA